jgi:two-component system, response regulator
MGKVILLVEDDGNDEALALRAFRKHGIAGDVVVARDGVEALDWMFARGAHAGRDAAVLPDLVLLDLNLPRLGGHDVLRELKADPRTQQVPVVILSSSVEETDVATGYELGANSYVHKPIGFDAYVDAIRAVGTYWLGLNLAPRP